MMQTKRCEVCDLRSEGLVVGWSIDPTTKGDVCPWCWDSILECLLEYGIEVNEDEVVYDYIAEPTLEGLLALSNHFGYLHTYHLENGPVASNLGLLEAIQDEGTVVDEDS